MNLPGRNWMSAVCLLSVTSLLVCQGCVEAPLQYTELKRIDEPVSEAELNTFLRIAKVFPDGQLPRFSQIFEAVPEWNPSRNLPVNELVEEQKQLLNRRWSVDRMTQYVQTSRPLHRALRKEQMTVDQFVSLALTLGVALSRSTLREDQDLNAIVRKGEIAMKRMQRDHRPFSSLSKAGMYYVLQQARAITRVHRASRLKMVPPENVALLQRHGETLKELFPLQFKINPLDPLTDPVEEQGVPFEEVVGKDSDDCIEWNRENALFGEQVPDSQLAVESGPRQLTESG